VSPTWLLLPVAGLLVALIGILAPAVWKEPPASVDESARGGQAASCTSPSPDSDRAGKEAPEETSVQQAKGNAPQKTQTQHPPTYRSLWPFSPAEKQKSCEHLAQLQDQERRQKAGDRLDFYAAWIAYLSLETSTSSTCNLEAAFRTATEAIAKRKLSGRGYAFLSSYYSYKRVLDRSRSFLEEALQIAPKDPWVRLVEGVFCERVLRDSKKAERILSGLLRKEPSFVLAQYHLAKIYLEAEEYGKAKDLFLALERTFPQQQGFMNIRQSLASIEHVPYFSVERAKGLLKVSRAFSNLLDYPLAGRLCRTVLEDMSDTLPNAEKKSAFYDLGRISEMTGDKETAFSCYQNALRIDPFYRDARERIGYILRGDAQTS
jgi:tetratricopeptide (TPR) repeat protein